MVSFFGRRRRDDGRRPKWITTPAPQQNSEIGAEIVGVDVSCIVFVQIAANPNNGSKESIVDIVEGIHEEVMQRISAKRVTR